MKNWQNSAKLFQGVKRAAGADPDGFSVLKRTKSGVSNPLFKRLKENILGRGYNLSLVLAEGALMRKLNKKHRGKNAPANVLSFSYSRGSGEIFLNPAQAKKEAKNFGMSSKKFLAFLFIHGTFHLKGYGHGSRMEKAEAGILKKISRL